MKVQVIINTNGEALGIPGEPVVTPVADRIGAQTAWNETVAQTARDHGWTVERLADEAGIGVDELGLTDVVYVSGNGIDIRRWVVETS